MQNDQAPEAAPLAVVPIEDTTEPGTGRTGDNFRTVMHELEELKEKPLFSEDELEEATEDDDLFDDEDYDLEEVIRRQKQKLEESRRKGGIVEEDDDDYYDDYSAEVEDEEQKRRAQEKLMKAINGADPANPAEKEDRIMQDYLSNIRSKSAPHRFKSKFDEFDDDDDDGKSDSELLSGSGSRKLRKNDSIKIISTPNGKVGIVYKVEPKPGEDEKGKLAKADGGGASGLGEPRQNKITPVITADGKVALLYRGASDNGDTFRNKYEPITAKDILQLIDNNNSNGSSSSLATSATFSSSTGTGASSNTNNSIKNITNNNIYNSHNNYDTSYGTFNRNTNNNVIVDSERSDVIGAREPHHESSVTVGGVTVAGGEGGRLGVTPADGYPPTTPMTRVVTGSSIRPPFDVIEQRPSHPGSTSPTNSLSSSGLEETVAGVGGRYGPSLDPGSDRGQENSLLINRPLSEVLGIRKSQYSEANTIKIPNIETSTNKMRITNGNNMLSSLLHNLHQQQQGISNGTGANHDENRHLGQQQHHLHHAAEDDRRRTGYSVNGFSRSRFYINRRTTPALPPRVIKEEESEEDQFVGADDAGSLPEVINLAIIPAFEHEIDEKYIRPNHGDFHRRHRQQYNVAPGQPAVHCAMQALVACAVLATFFGIVGTYFKSRVVDHIRVLYW